MRAQWPAGTPVKLRDSRGTCQPPWAAPTITAATTLRDLKVQGFREVELRCRAGCGWANRQGLDFLARRLGGLGLSLEDLCRRARCRNCDGLGAEVAPVEPPDAPAR